MNSAMKHRNIFTKNCELYLRIDTPCIYTIQNSLGSEFRSCAKSIIVIFLWKTFTLAR